MPIEPKRMMRRLLFLGLVSCALWVPAVLTGCGNSNQTANKLAQDSKELEEFDSSLTFNSVTLEEFDNKGQLWWKVKAKQARYSRDQKTALVVEPNGEFYQDGKPILKVSAQKGEVRQDGKTIFLRGAIKAIDTRDGLVLQGNELEWRPQDDLLIVRNQVVGTHRQASASAKEGKFYSRKRRLDLEGGVKAVSKDPNLRFNSERVVWQIVPETLTSDRAVQIERYEGKTTTDRAIAGQGSANLKTKTATLKQNAQIALKEPPLQIGGNDMQWNLNTQIIASNQPLTLVNRQQGVTLSGNQGTLNLKTDSLLLTGNVQGADERNQSQLAADRLQWNIKTQVFNAQGNVNYRQASPFLNLTGPTATGTLKDQQVVVSGNRSDGRVVTEFFP